MDVTLCVYQWSSSHFCSAQKCFIEWRANFCKKSFLVALWLAEEVFMDTQPLIRSVLDGYNVCIFAYGQTGSGKTFTMVSGWGKRLLILLICILIWHHCWTTSGCLQAIQSVLLLRSGFFSMAGTHHLTPA
jgi:hypothetical protein